MVVNNRLDKNKLTGDFSTPEQKIPDTGIPGKDWETCMTMNSTWGYKSFDHSWKPTERLIRNLIDIASKGLSAPVESATLLADQKKLEAKNSAAGVVVTVPTSAPDPISSTIVLKVKGKLAAQ